MLVWHVRLQPSSSTAKTRGSVLKQKCHGHVRDSRSSAPITGSWAIDASHIRLSLGRRVESPDDLPHSRGDSFDACQQSIVPERGPGDFVKFTSLSLVLPQEQSPRLRIFCIILPISPLATCSPPRERSILSVQPRSKESRVCFCCWRPCSRADTSQPVSSVCLRAERCRTARTGGEYVTH